MTRKLLTVEDFKDSAKDGERPEGTVTRLAVADTLATIDETRTIRFVFSDGTVDRAGDRIDPKGWEVDNFLKNPVALWAHDSFSPPIGRASGVGPRDGKLVGDIQFMPADISTFADSVYRMVRANYVKAVSVGFMPLEWSFVSEKERPFGIDFKRQELLEISICPVPCNPNALEEARSKGIDTGPLAEWAERCLAREGAVWVPRDLLEETFRQAKTSKAIRAKYLTPKPKADAAKWEVGAARDLPLDQNESWDGPAAEDSIFAHAGGDEFNPEVAKKGFLLFNSAEPKLRGSYKEPFARVDNGTLKAVKGGVRAAASRLPQTDVSQSAKDEAKGVIDHYEKAFGMGDGKTRAAGEGTNAGGGAVTADNGEIVVNPPAGNCGNAKDEECGMKDPQQCATHFVPPVTKPTEPDADDKALKAGRRISAANKALLQQAQDHHAKATECIKQVLESGDPSEPDADDDPSKVAAAAVDQIIAAAVAATKDPEEQRQARLAEVQAIKESLK